LSQIIQSANNFIKILLLIVS